MRIALTRLKHLLIRLNVGRYCSGEKRSTEIGESPLVHGVRGEFYEFMVSFLVSRDDISVGEDVCRRVRCRPRSSRRHAFAEAKITGSGKRSAGFELGWPMSN